MTVACACDGLCPTRSWAETVSGDALCPYVPMSLQGMLVSLPAGWEGAVSRTVRCYRCATSPLRV
jgi:hypothetical protein